MANTVRFIRMEFRLNERKRKGNRTGVMGKEV